MTKRIQSKRKPYLQTGENLWGKSHLLWKSNDKWKYNAGEHKKKHRSFERTMALTSYEDLNKMYSLGYFTTIPSEKVRISYNEPRYSTLLREKQKLKKTYINMTESQFKYLYNYARKSKGKVGDNLLKLLERRLDISLVRVHIVPSLYAARQLISHGHVVVNGCKVFNSNMYLNSGDHVCVLHSLKGINNYSMENTDAIVHCSNIEVDYRTMSYIYLYSPEVPLIPYWISYHLDQIIRYYS